MFVLLLLLAFLIILFGLWAAAYCISEILFLKGKRSWSKLYRCYGSIENVYQTTKRTLSGLLEANSYLVVDGVCFKIPVCETKTVFKASPARIYILNTLGLYKVIYWTVC